MDETARQGVRVERDSLGPVEVPADSLWGAQTQRSLEHFRISGERMPLPIVHALVLVKKAVAQVNAELGRLETAKAQAIATACDEVLTGRWDEEFPLLVWQTGSGTQTNMNVNEVLANRASELLGGPRGERRLVHPNDDVNQGHSTNDAFPSALHLALLAALQRDVMPAIRRLRDAFAAKAEAFRGVVKIGRTHLMDATPLTLGQELSAWVTQLDQGLLRLAQTLPSLRELALGGSAVGTGINAHPELGTRVAARLAALTGEALVSAPNKFEALAARDAAVFAHAALKNVAIALFKIAGDVKLLASGPRAGLGELRLPENEPGSSIMPGKINPTQAEALSMAAAQVLGNDVAVGLAGLSGQLQLNAFMPLIAHAVLQSCRLVADGCDGFRERCVTGLEPVPARLRENVERSLMLVTALSARVGYDAAARIARHAHERDTTLREAALALGLLTEEQFDEWVRPERMVGDVEL